MAYRVVIKRSDVDLTDTFEAPGIGTARDIAGRAVKDGVCQRVDIYDPALSRDTPIVSYEQILEEIEAEAASAASC